MPGAVFMLAHILDFLKLESDAVSAAWGLLWISTYVSMLVVPRIYNQQISLTLLKPCLH